MGQSLCSVPQSCPTLCNPMHCSTPGFLVQQLLELTQTHVHQSVMPSNHVILCCPLLLLPSIFPSIRVFSNESVLYIRWPKYQRFSFSISPSNEYLRLISFRMDWFNLLEVHGLSRVFSNTTVQEHQAQLCVMVQLSYPYRATGKTKTLTRWTFVDKVMSPLFLICCLGWSQLFFQRTSVF